MVKFLSMVPDSLKSANNEVRVVVMHGHPSLQEVSGSEQHVLARIKELVLDYGSRLPQN